MVRNSGWLRVIALAALAMLCDGTAFGQPPAPAPAAGAALPGGANSVQETFDDWRVACVAQADNHKMCGAVQEQADGKTHQRLLAIQFEAPSRDHLGGMLVLPFGLALDRAVVPQVDDGTAEAPLRFRTCVPAGCLVPLAFDAKFMATLRKGSVLKLKAVSDGGGEVAFAVSLKGLPNALERLAVLAR